MSSTHKSNSFLFGALIGAALGVLFAPGPGKETRKKLKVKSKIALDDASFVLDKVQTTTGPLIDEVEEKVGPLLKKIKNASEPVKKEVLDTIDRLVDESIKMQKKKIFKGIKKA